MPERITVVILSIDEPVFINPFIEAVCRHRLFQVKAVLALPAVSLLYMGRRSRQKPALLLTNALLTLLSYGVADAARLAGFLLCGGRGRTPGLREIAAAAGADYHEVGGVNDDDTRRLIKGHAPRVVLHQTPHFVAPATLATAPLWLNRHAGLLPSHRGCYPIFWGFLRGERTFGMTFHALDERLDHGATVLEARYERRPGESLASLYRRNFSLASRSLDLLAERLAAAGPAVPVARTEEDGRRHPCLGVPHLGDILAAYLRTLKASLGVLRRKE